MASFTFKVGSLDLAQYVRVGPGEGLDPYGQGLEEPLFLDGPFAEGQPLVTLDARNRVMTWPLYLKAASKDLLHALEQDINQEIRYAARPLRVEWKDDSASASTFYDVAHARFDPDYNFRQGQQEWMGGRLTVWCQPPWGHTATERIVATSVATGIMSAATIPVGSLVGDVSGQPVVRFARQSGGIDNAMVVGVSVVPASYTFEYTASQFSAGGGAITVQGNAIGSTVLQGATRGLAGQVVLDAAYYKGARHRVFALARNNDTSNNYAWWAQNPLAGTTTDGSGVVTAPPGIGPTYYASQSANSSYGFELMDLGVLSIPSSFPLATSALIVRANRIGTAAASSRPQLNAIYLLPEDSLTIARATGFAPSGIASACFDATQDAAHQVQALGGIPIYEDLNGARLGPIPNVPVASMVKVIAVHAPYRGEPKSQIVQQVAIRERFSFAR